jgi:Transglycosylase SLT domain/Sel1 repeat
MTFFRGIPIFLGLILISTPALANLHERTLKALEQLSQSGSVRATFELARHYEMGVGIEINYTKAFDLYCQAATKGHTEASYHVALMYLNGQGVKESRSDAAAWIGKAVDSGHPYAAEVVAEMKGVKPAAVASCRRPETPQLQAPAKILKLVEDMAPQYGLDPALVLAVISVESNFRANVVSPMNAQGLMQLIPVTAARFGVTNPFDPKENIRGGMKYLRWLLSYFGGNVPLAVAAYNAGEGAVVKHRGIPPYAETKAYVRKVLSVYPRERHPFEADLASPSGDFVRALRQTVAELN